MRTAIRTAPYGNNESPKLHNLPQRVKVWLSEDDPDYKEIQHMNNIYFAANLDTFYREQYRACVPCWDDPICCIGSNILLVFSEEDCSFLRIVRREEFEKAYIISGADGIFHSNDLIALNEKIAAYFQDV